MAATRQPCGEQSELALAAADHEIASEEEDFHGVAVSSIGCAARRGATHWRYTRWTGQPYSSACPFDHRRLIVVSAATGRPGDRMALVGGDDRSRQIRGIGASAVLEFNGCVASPEWSIGARQCRPSACARSAKP
jgi:hypothetical protein